MSQQDRAAQFAPFAALSGFEGEIVETARMTDTEVELTEWAAEQVDAGLRKLQRELNRQPEVTLTYFDPDGRKSGGAYRSITARVRKILELERMLLLEDDTRIPMDRIVNVTVR
jgi:hypothetical protein